MIKSEGLISGEDNQRYQFISSEWKEATAPQKGMSIEFIADQDSATAIYLCSDNALTGSHDDSWYKSSDSKFFAGVCSGLAHKFNVSILGLRIVTVLVSIFFLVPAILYIVLWILLPSKPTKP